LATPAKHVDEKVLKKVLHRPGLRHMIAGDVHQSESN
jgi:hypothetical protein